MCGIAGLLALQGNIAADERALKRLRTAIAYRGQDDAGFWTDGSGVSLCHSRLSIIDLTTGHQPMEDGRGRYVIAYNGEIYNYRELRAEYEKSGALFHTQSDTEVILEGYRLKGAAVCGDLNGMFAFALWDKAERTLFLARDRLGKKPLFWTLQGGQFGFASTLDAFSGMPGWDGQIDQAALAMYALTGAIPGEATIYEGAHALPAGCYATVRLGERPRVSRYWRPDFSAKARAPLAAQMEEYESLLTDAVRIRLRSDVPLALTFSGGVDSGSIAAVCARKLQTPLTCYTIDYHTEDDPSEETVNAAAVAHHLGLDWRHIQFDYHKELLGDLPGAYRYYDQPCHQMAMVYSARLYGAIKPYATVVLSGNGADELFTGYNGDEQVRRKDIALGLLRWARPALAELPVSPYLRLSFPRAFAESIRIQAASFIGSEAVEERLIQMVEKLAQEAEAAAVRTALDWKMWFSLFYGNGDSNFRVPDISGLAAQVEVRSPYLDYRMVEFAARLPHRYKVGRLFSARANKFLPKNWYARHVSHDLAWSRKKGMGWNLRWDRSIAFDPLFETAFEDTYRAVADAGLFAESFRAAWRQYVTDVRSGKGGGGSSGIMMTGFMLGAWLKRNKG